MIEETVTDMYRINDENRFLEVTYQGRQRSVVLQGLRERRHDREHRSSSQEARGGSEIAEKGRGLRAEDLTESIRQEYRENEDLRTRRTRTTGTRVGKKGERIIFIRTS